MSTRTTSSDFTNATDAQFRTWGKWFRDCFSAAGWTLDSEVFGTGTNWTDVTAPSAANQARVTVIFHMADTAAGTAPLYIKLYIGSGGAAGNPGFRFEIGTGLSGTNITGSLHDTGTTHLSATATTQTMTHYSSGDAGRVWIAMTVSGTSWAAGQQLFFSIERRKNGTGADQTTGFLVFWAGGTSGSMRAFLAAAAGPSALSTINTVMCISAAAFDGKEPIGPILYNLGHQEIGLAGIAFIAAAHSVGSTFAVTVLGSSHTYLATQYNSSVTHIGGSASYPLGLRYE